MTTTTAFSASDTPIENIVLVHGAWGNSLHWQGVIPLLIKKGFKVTAVSLPLTSFELDVKKTQAVLAAQNGPTVLVGHSYGGAVISAAGVDDKVKALVYVAAYSPEKGESVFSLSSKAGTPPEGFFQQDANGFLLLNRGMFVGAFCHDVLESQATAMNMAQNPTHPAALQGVLSAEPAWKTKPSWVAVTTEDHTIPVDLQRTMVARLPKKQVIEVPASHAVMVSRPEIIADLIGKAAKG